MSIVNAARHDLLNDCQTLSGSSEFLSTRQDLLKMAPHAKKRNLEHRQTSVSCRGPSTPFFCFVIVALIVHTAAARNVLTAQEQFFHAQSERVRLWTKSGFGHPRGTVASSQRFVPRCATLILPPENTLQSSNKNETQVRLVEVRSSFETAKLRAPSGEDSLNQSKEVAFGRPVVVSNSVDVVEDRSPHSGNVCSELSQASRPSH